MATVYIENAEILYSDSARVKMKMNTKLLENYTRLDTPYIEMKQGVKVIFYDIKGTEQSSLTAKYAKYIELLDLWEYKGDVRIVNTDKDVLETQHLFADNKKEELYSDVKLVITRSTGNIIRANGGFRSDFNFKNYTMKKVQSGSSKKEDWEF